MKDSTRPEESGKGGDSGGDEMYSDSTEAESVKLSPKSHWHDKCLAGYKFEIDLKKKKKKTPKKYREEVVKFVKGIPDADAETLNSSRKSLLGSGRWKGSRYNTQIRFLEHKYIQCNIVNTNEDAEVTLPDEIKPLLINLTFLLHELKQRPESKSQDDLCNVISKIVSLLAELSKRPIKRFDESPKPLDEIANKLGAILKEHNGPENEQYVTLVNEVKRLEQEVIQKDSEVNYVKDQIREERARFMPEPNSFDDRLRNSIRKNQSLRAEIKYNKAQFRKYEKMLVQKEQLKQKSLLELNHLRKKCARLEQKTEKAAKSGYTRLHQADSDVSRGGSLTKYIKSKVHKEKSRSRVGKTKRIAVNKTKLE